MSGEQSFAQPRPLACTVLSLCAPYNEIAVGQGLPPCPYASPHACVGGCCTEWPSWEEDRLMACGALGRSWDISAAIALQIASGACLLVPWWPGGRGATPRPSSRIVVASSSFVEPPFARPHGQGNEAENKKSEFSYVVPRSQTDCGITRSNCLDWMQQWKRHN